MKKIGCKTMKNNSQYLVDFEDLIVLLCCLLSTWKLLPSISSTDLNLLSASLSDILS